MQSSNSEPIIISHAAMKSWEYFSNIEIKNFGTNCKQHHLAHKYDK
jgi:hypothetical protein